MSKELSCYLEVRLEIFKYGQTIEKVRITRPESCISDVIHNLRWIIKEITMHRRYIWFDFKPTCFSITDQLVCLSVETPKSRYKHHLFNYWGKHQWLFLKNRCRNNKRQKTITNVWGQITNVRGQITIDTPLTT